MLNLSIYTQLECFFLVFFPKGEHLHRYYNLISTQKFFIFEGVEKSQCNITYSEWLIMKQTTLSFIIPLNICFDTKIFDPTFTLSSLKL